MMADPKFVSEMKRYTQDPAFKQAMGRAGEKVEELARDPVKLKKAEADFTEALKA